MADEKTDRPDRYATGTGQANTDAGEAERDEFRPGTTGGGTVQLPDAGRASMKGTGADQSEGTIGAVGEMDITGAPAGPTGGSSLSGGSGSGESQGGGPGGGASASGGTGPAPADDGPQSIRSTLAVLGDGELSTTNSGASGTGGAGGSDAAGDDARTGSAIESRGREAGTNE